MNVFSYRGELLVESLPYRNCTTCYMWCSNGVLKGTFVQLSGSFGLKQTCVEYTCEVEGNQPTPHQWTASALM